MEVVDEDAIVVVDRDLNFTITAKVDDCMVEFKIYDIVGWVEGSISGIYDKPLYPTFREHTEDIDKAEVYLSGHIKWDGCSNWNFDEQDRGMIHGCTKHDLERISGVMLRCWDMTSSLCPNWCPNWDQ